MPEGEQWFEGYGADNNVGGGAAILRESWEAGFSLSPTSSGIRLRSG